MLSRIAIQQPRKGATINALEAMNVNRHNPKGSRYHKLRGRIKSAPRTWLVTGVAGFIGSNLLETVLKLDQRVNGLDNFSSGKKRNLEEVRARVTPSQWARFHLFRGDIANPKICREACSGVEIVLHHAALASVPRSLDDPLACHRSNVTGFLNMLLAARDAGAKRFVYASSSAVYGDDPALPKKEDHVSQSLSPYAASKTINEVYAGLFTRAYGLSCIGLRYFNIFGPRQDPEGGYAAVIPKWMAALLKREPVFINGDGRTSRDFCFIEDVIQANLLAGMAAKSKAPDQVYNIGLGNKTTLNELFRLLKNALKKQQPSFPDQKPIHRAFRPGDIRHSVADITKARRQLGYAPAHGVQQGLEWAMDWYQKNA
jgi:UDP-N-acetylglucosamine 4-epimerase